LELLLEAKDKAGMNNTNHWLRQNIGKYFTYWEIVIFLISLTFFGAIILHQIPTDIQAYPVFIQKTKAGAMYPPANFIYYLVVYTIALFRTDTESLLIASVITLSLAVSSKFAITRIFYVEHYSDFSDEKKTNLSFKVSLLVTLFSVSMLVVSNLPGGKHWYLGQIPSSVWHNSTVIFLMPFSLLLFVLSYKQLLSPRRASILIITLLCILNILIKPSFFFAFAIAYPLMLLRRFGITKSLLHNLFPILIGCLVLIVMYYCIYIMNFGSLSVEKSGTAVKPFFVWSHFSSNIFTSLVLSLVFPIIFLGLYWKNLLNQLIVQYSIALYLAGIFIFSLAAETGPREFDGNFFWQSVVCSYILFMVLSSLFVREFRISGLGNWKNMAIFIAFLMQVTSGFAYMAKIVTTKIYI
jgi:hypothetical protein